MRACVEDAGNLIDSLRCSKLKQYFFFIFPPFLYIFWRAAHFPSPPSSYFRCYYSFRFDFVVVIVSWLGVALDLQPSIVGNRGSTGLSLVRVLRVGRILRLIPRVPGLLKLFNTLVLSLPALLNIGGVMLGAYFFSLYVLLLSAAERDGMLAALF